MKYLKNFNESVFIKQEDVDKLLDKINASGIESLDDIDKNRLTLFTVGDKEIIDTIEKMGDITAQFKEVNIKMRELSDAGEDPFILMSKWDELNKKLVPLEQSFRKYGVDLGDPRLNRLMSKIRPDVY